MCLSFDTSPYCFHHPIEEYFQINNFPVYLQYDAFTKGASSK
jgi:hypothetical protein